jgi:arylformamidase
MTQRIIVASDHAGLELKSHIKLLLLNLGYIVDDAGTYSAEPVDYPEFTLKAALKLAASEYDKGIVFCGTGQGDAMVANKVPGVRAALCWDVTTARLSRAHNDANMLVLGGWTTMPDSAEEIVRTWLSTPFEGGRHARRVNQIKHIEMEMLTHRRGIYDISRSIENGMLVWPGDTPVEVKTIDCENKYRFTTLRLSAHAGTHADAPAHFIKGGRGIDKLDLDVLMGPARVLQLTDSGCINRHILEKIPLEGETRLLLGTVNSRIYDTTTFRKDYVSLTEDAATYLVNCGIKLLALDSLSVDRFDTTTYPVHHILLNAGVVIVEGVDLKGVPAGKYELLCLPLNIKDADGAPVRVILREV